MEKYDKLSQNYYQIPTLSVSVNRFQWAVQHKIDKKCTLLVTTTSELLEGLKFGRRQYAFWSIIFAIQMGAATLWNFLSILGQAQ